MFTIGKREAPGRVTRDRDTDAVIVTKKEGKTYADLLRMVKYKMKTVSKEATGVIKQIRQMRDGNMLITMERDQQKTGQLTQESLRCLRISL